MSNYYAIRDGLVISPGKFQGCPEWAPYFHLAEGDWVDKDGLEWWVIDIIAEDRQHYPILRDARKVWMREDEQGFVHVMLE
jgi:hypothetical protein